MNDILEIYTDGASRGNPGPGGFGVVLLWKGVRKELGAGYRKTTNNRMELLAVIIALESLTRTGMPIRLYTDSKYVVDAIEKKWVYGWIKIGFKNKKNADLWQRFMAIYPKHQVQFIWVKGHANNRENNRCDAIATAFADGTDLRIDEGFESGLYN